MIIGKRGHFVASINLFRSTTVHFISKIRCSVYALMLLLVLPFVAAAATLPEEGRETK